MENHNNIRYNKSNSYKKRSNLYQHYKYKTALYNMVKRDFIVKYRRSILGIFWSLLNPLLMMIIISSIFSYYFRFDIKFYPVFYLLGHILFSMFAAGTTGSLYSIIEGSELIKKMYLPKYLFPVEKCLFEFINTSVSIFALIIVILWLQVPFSTSWFLMPVPFLYILIFSIGVSLALSSFNVYFRDIGHLYSVLIQLFMFLTPIFYPVSILTPKMMAIMQFNPLYHFIDYFRVIILNGQIPSMEAHLICAGFAFGTFLLGALIFKLLERKFILYI